MPTTSRRCFSPDQLIVIGILLLFAISAVSAPTSSFKVRRGNNIAHWLSQSDRRGAERRAFFTREDVAFLAGLGFDHLRIPIDEEQMWDESGKRNEEAFALLNQALDWCAEYKLNAIVDLHILRSHHFNDKKRPLWTEAKAQERFLQCWRDLSDALHTRSIDTVAYELLNEPVADNPDDWNALVKKAVAVIREKEPGRVIVVGSNLWQSVDMFPKLRIPENDRNLLLSFHFYQPLLVTHYRASWTPFGGYQGPIRYPGRSVDDKDMAGLPEPVAKEMRKHNGDWNSEKISRKIEQAAAVAKKAGLPLYCGEWGCTTWTPIDVRKTWYQDMIRIFNEKGIGWATWQYKGAFWPVRRGDGTIDTDLTGILFSKQPGER